MAPDSLSRALVPEPRAGLAPPRRSLQHATASCCKGEIGVAASKAVLSDQNFVRLYRRYQQFFPVGQLDTLTLRGEVGYTIADSRNGIPQEASSAPAAPARCWLTVSEPRCPARVGHGRRPLLATASAEYTHWLDEQWGSPPSSMPATPSMSLSDVSLAVGYGVGGRWRTPPDRSASMSLWPA